MALTQLSSARILRAQTLSQQINPNLLRFPHMYGGVYGILAILEEEWTCERWQQSQGSVKTSYAQLLRSEHFEKVCNTNALVRYLTSLCTCLTSLCTCLCAQMPASPVNMLDTEKPNKITLLGKDLVAWFNSRGSQSWEVVEDRCPHSTEGLAMPGVIGSWTPFCEASPSLSLDGPELLQAWGQVLPISQTCLGQGCRSKAAYPLMLCIAFQSSAWDALHFPFLLLACGARAQAQAQAEARAKLWHHWLGDHGPSRIPAAQALLKHRPQYI
eukprot:803326-Pelagomonas_calceolata.AAC.3